LKFAPKVPQVMPYVYTSPFQMNHGMALAMASLSEMAGLELPHQPSISNSYPPFGNAVLPVGSVQMIKSASGESSVVFGPNHW
jgi:hypothetical protein